MKLYEQFHGETVITNIGKELRDILKYEQRDFKILTGYGSTSCICLSKQAAIKSLTKLKKEGKIKGFLPGEIKYQVIDNKSPYFEDKSKYVNRIKSDKDYGNEGVIFVFVK